MLSSEHIEYRLIMGFLWNLLTERKFACSNQYAPFYASDPYCFVTRRWSRS